MIKANDLAATFLRKKTPPTQTPTVQPPINAFHSLFSVQELNDTENRTIEKIIVDGYRPGIAHEEQIHDDIHQIKNISKELKAIRKQGAILIGERIYNAKKIFERYNDRSFRQWIEFVFSSYKTGYNYLAYYQLYTNIPDDLKESLKEMPAKAVYVLASKKAPIAKKIEIVKTHSKEKAEKLLTLIRQTFDEKEPEALDLIDHKLAQLERLTSQLLFHKEELTNSQKKRLSTTIKLLKSV